MTLKIELTREWEPERIAPFWPSALGCLQRVIEEFPEEYTLPWLVEELRSGRRDLWIVHDPDEEPHCVMACITQVVISAAGRKTIEMTECGGERMKEALDFILEVEKWAASEGIKNARFIGRPGWSRLLRPYGYARWVETLEKKIGE